MGKQYWKPGNMLYPVPAVMVSCGRPGERANIITVAWAGTVCSEPAMVSISVRPERYSYDIIRDTGEFVINLVTKELAYATDYCGVKSGRDVDKYQNMHLTPLPSRHIACKVEEVRPLGSHHMFLARVTGVTVEEAWMNESGKFCLNETELVTYSHGEYFTLGEKLGKFGFSVKKRKSKD